MNFRSPRLWLPLAAIWLLSGAVTLGWAAFYRATPGEPGQAPDEWPASSTLRRDASRPTLVMLAHPRCPCTRASLAELAKLMTEVGDRAVARVVFVEPAGVGADWMDTEAVRAARNIPGVTVEVDRGGREAALFGAETSGDVLAYAPNGQLLFAGGITGARDHVGDNGGHDALRTAVVTGAAQGDGPVYGCALHAPASPTGGRP